MTGAIADAFVKSLMQPKKPMNKTPGQSAYEKWCEFHSALGSGWPDLNETEKEQWESIATAGHDAANKAPCSDPSPAPETQS